MATAPQVESNPLNEEERSLIHEEKAHTLHDVRNLKEVERWYPRALAIAAVSLAFNLITFIGCYICGTAVDSPALKAIAVSALCDTIDDVVVLWRFKRSESDQNSERREAQGTVVCSLVMATLAVLGIIETSIKLSRQEKPRHSPRVMIVMCAIMLFTALLSVAKFVCASVLSSRLMFLDACSTISVTLLSGVWLMSAHINEETSSAWMLDAVVALCVESVLIGLAVFMLLKYQWLQTEFWRMEDSCGNIDN